MKCNSFIPSNAAWQSSAGTSQGSDQWVGSALLCWLEEIEFLRTQWYERRHHGQNNCQLTTGICVQCVSSPSMLDLWRKFILNPRIKDVGLHPSIDIPAVSKRDSAVLKRPQDNWAIGFTQNKRPNATFTVHISGKQYSICFFVDLASCRLLPREVVHLFDSGCRVKLVSSALNN